MKGKWKYLLIIISIILLIIVVWKLLPIDSTITSLIYLIYIVSFLLISYLIWDYKKIKKNTELERRHSLVQVVSVIIAIALALHSLVISIDALKSSDIATNRTIGILNNISKSSEDLSDSQIKIADRLSKIPDQLDKFSSGIDSLNKLINIQQATLSSNIRNLNESSDSLRSNLLNYSQSLGKFSSELNSIIVSTDKQLKIWTEQQELMKKEFNRKPILDLKFGSCISTDSSFTIDGINLSNKGNIECNILRVFLVLDKKYLEKVDFPEAKERNEPDLFKDQKMFELYLKGSTYGEMIIMDSTGSRIPLKVSYKSRNITLKPIIIVRIDALSKYKNKLYNFSFLGCEQSRNK